MNVGDAPALDRTVRDHPSATREPAEHSSAAPRHRVKPETDKTRNLAGDDPAVVARQRDARTLPAAAQKARLVVLASLLSDDSPLVWDEVRRQFEQAGARALPTLRKAAQSAQPLVRARARSLLAERDKRFALRRLLRYSLRDKIDLERALFLLGRHRDPHLDPRPHQRALDAMAAEVARRAKKKQGELSRALCLSEYLGGELEYGGSIADFHHPDNIHLHCAIERRAGMPLTLCAIYMFVARRAGFRVAPLPLPGHVMLRIYGSNQSVIVDPYERGKARSEADCRKYLEQHKLAFHPAWLSDAGDAVMLKRQVMNLLRSTQARGLKRDARELSTLMRALEPRFKADPSVR
jgi:regulator of sirC expression with transglutaminase-like and TPR domain